MSSLPSKPALPPEHRAVRVAAKHITDSRHVVDPIDDAVVTNPHPEQVGHPAKLD